MTAEDAAALPMPPQPMDPAADGAVIMFRGELVGLGPLDRRHLPLYVRWMNDPEVARGLGHVRPHTREAEEQWYERAATGTNSIHFTIYELESLAPIGTCGLLDIDQRNGRATFGINVGDKRCWNRGYGTEATRLTLDYAFSVLGLHNVMLAVYGFNARARRAYEKAGFRLIGRRRGAIFLAGRRHDELLMDAVPEEFESPVLAALLGAEQERPGV